MEREFRHKTAGKGQGQDRFPDPGDALELVRKLAKEHPKGPLFLTGKGRRLHKHLGRSGWTDKTLTSASVT